MPGWAAPALTVSSLRLFVTLRTSLTLSFETRGRAGRDGRVHADGARHRKIRNRIDALAESSGLGKTYQSLCRDRSFSWPWAWYVRDYHDVQYAEPAYPGLPGQAWCVYLLTEQPLGIRRQLSSPGPYKHRWWFEKTYHDLGAEPSCSISSLARRV